jgi:TPR repeat protein
MITYANKIIYFLFMVLLGLFLTAAVEAYAIDDEHYKTLLEAGKDKEAFEYISKGDDENALLYTGVHYLSGQGVQKDTCKAVLVFEKLYEIRRHLALFHLTSIYGNSWGYIASQEGSAPAAYEAGLGLWHPALLDYYNVYGRKRDDFLKGSKAHEKAYKYFSLARSLGYVKAEKPLADLIAEYPYLKDMKFDYKNQSIICPIREKKE